MTTVGGAIEGLIGDYQSYLEAAYHISHPSIIRARRRLFEHSAITSEVWVEAPPQYPSDKAWKDQDLPAEIVEILDLLSSGQTAVYDRPYPHQAEALHDFFANHRNLVVSTGTASGKTEIFLYAFLGLLAQESKRGRTTEKRAMRAIILYPMNALVSDQLARLRLLVGQEKTQEILRGRFGRPIQFGMYTSRTPYHGTYSVKRNRRDVAPIVQFFTRLSTENPDLYRGLAEKGRVPAKDLGSFNSGRGERRFRTAPLDAELFTRQEMHNSDGKNVNGGVPDILVTNYSMLEYMLLRPIERTLFTSTSDWLNADERNELLLVIDEAHFYRGAQGAEVGMLVRRLMQRLGVSADRLRVILTSATLGSEAESVGTKFGADLSGAGQESFRVITAAPPRPPEPPEPAESLDLFSNVPPEINAEVVERLAEGLGQSASQGESPQEALGRILSPTQAFQRLRRILFEGKAPLSQIGTDLWPSASADDAERSALGLLHLASAATHRQRHILPIRLHMFFRGLPAVYACADPDCPQAEEDSRGVVGKLFLAPRHFCDCGSRVYELLTHRTCGAAYLRAYLDPDDVNAADRFLWTEPSARNEDFIEIHILVEDPRVEPLPDNRSLEHLTPQGWLSLETGFIQRAKPVKPIRSRRVWIPGHPDPVSSSTNPPWSWPECPACGIRETRREDGSTNIMDLQTKGEEPFAVLVSSLFSILPADPVAKEYPNGGKKVLCFSDSRQKAARLARDLQRSVEVDAFIELLAFSLSRNGGSFTYDETWPQMLFAARELRLAFFDDSDEDDRAAYPGSRTMFRTAKGAVEDIIHAYQLTTPGDILVDDEAREELDETSPHQFKSALLRAAGDKFYSIRARTIGYLIPSDDIIRAIGKALPAEEDAAAAIAEHIVHKAATIRAIDPKLSPEIRAQSRASLYYSRRGWPLLREGIAPSKLISQEVRRIVESVLNEEVDWVKVENALTRRQGASPPLFRPLDRSPNAYLVLHPKSIEIRLAPSDTWYRCEACRQYFPLSCKGRCLECGGPLQESPSGDLIRQTRRGYFVQPVQRIIDGDRKPFTIRSEEHSAQISEKEFQKVFSPAEMYELEFQDIIVDRESQEQPIDVLSCTTTMEVGIDIGSLNAVGLRTIPPRPENYQQRSGRAGRRGLGVSLSITFADQSPHETFYFENPQEIVSRDPAPPIVYIGNERISSRHIASSLISLGFDSISATNDGEDDRIGMGVFEALGSAGDFFLGSRGWCLSEFKGWLDAELSSDSSEVLNTLAALLPSGIGDSGEAPHEVRIEFVRSAALEFLDGLEDLASRGDWKNVQSEEDLLKVLLDAALLPRFSFPLDLATFTVKDNPDDKPVVRYRPSTDLRIALSQYSPGREIVIDKRTYLSYGLDWGYAPNGLNRASFPSVDWANLRPLHFCEVCETIFESETRVAEEACPVCRTGNVITEHTNLKPEGFAPRYYLRGIQEVGSREKETQPYLTTAKFPLPINGDRPGSDETLIGSKGKVTYRHGERLWVVNFGNSYEGFDVCTLCGAAAPRGSLPERHSRPYPKDIRVTRRWPAHCNGSPRNVVLGMNFKTDLAVLTIECGKDLRYEPESADFKAVCQSLSEAILIAATRTLEIDSSELGSGYRLRPSGDSRVSGYVDIYLYDITPGGGGFAPLVAKHINTVIDEARKILDSCVCERSCHRCLRTYENRFFHSSMDRFPANALLDYLLEGHLTPLDIDRSSVLLHRLETFLEILEPEVAIRVEPQSQMLTVANDGQETSIRVASVLDAGTEPLLGHERAIADAEIIDSLPDACYEILQRVFAGDNR